MVPSSEYCTVPVGVPPDDGLTCAETIMLDDVVGEAGEIVRTVDVAGNGATVNLSSPPTAAKVPLPA